MSFGDLPRSSATTKSFWERVEYDVSTKDGKAKAKSMTDLYTLILEKYTMVHLSFPDGMKKLLP